VFLVDGDGHSLTRQRRSLACNAHCPAEIIPPQPGPRRKHTVACCGGLEEDDSEQGPKRMKQDLGGAKPTLLVPVDLASIANKSVAEERQAAQHSVPPPSPSLVKDVCLSNFLPCKLSGLAADWPAVHKWSADYLRSVVGTCEVNVMRSSSTAFYGDLGRHSPSTATVAEVLDNTRAAAEYMYIAQEPLWHQGSSASVDSCPLAPLLADLPQSPPSFVVRCTYTARACAMHLV
jgi:hypothetical protein